MKAQHLAKRSFFYGDRIFANLTRGLGLLLIILLVGILISLIILSWPSIKQFGWGFIVSQAWDPSNDNFGALTAILGTLVASLIAMVIAVPFSFGIAVLISEILPRRLGHVVARIIELMAGIPSIIYGMWGLFVLVPFMAKDIQPFLIGTEWERSSIEPLRDKILIS